MRFEVPLALIKMFEETGKVEVRDLFDARAQAQIETLLLEKGPIEGRRNFFKNAKWKKLLFGSGATDVVANLTHARALQIGSDQVYLPGELPENFTLQMLDAALGELTRLAEKEISYKAISSIAPLTCGLLVVRGENATFFSPRTVMEAPSEPCIICSWFAPGGRYVENRNDKLGHLLMREGYSFGDIIRSSTHPIVKK